MATPFSAAGAYASISGMGAGNLMRRPAGNLGGSDAAGTDFAGLIGKALEATSDVGRKADAQTASVAETPRNDLP